MKFTGACSSIELQWPYSKIGHQDSSSSNGHQDDTPLWRDISFTLNHRGGSRAVCERRSLHAGVQESARVGGVIPGGTGNNSKECDVITSHQRNRGWNNSSTPSQQTQQRQDRASMPDLRGLCVDSVGWATAFVSRYVPLMIASSMSWRFLRSSSPSGCNIKVKVRVSVVGQWG